MTKQISQLLAFNQKKVLQKKQCGTLNSNLVMRKKPCPVKMKIQVLFQNSVAAKGGEKETYESSGDSQNFQFTPGEVNQSQGITDTYADDAEHRCTHTLSLKDVGFRKELSNEEIAYWIERGPSKVQHSCGPFSSSKQEYKKQSRFCTKALFYATKVNGETYSREWLVYSPAKGRVYCFVNSFQIMHLFRL